MIKVTRKAGENPLSFDVVVTQSDESWHHVTMSPEDHARLGQNRHSPEDVIRAAFRFLLDREPQDAILGRFDVDVIPTYFPEFEEELPAYLASE